MREIALIESYVGLGHIQERRFKDALTILRGAVARRNRVEESRVHPDTARILVYLAQALQGLGEFNDARRQSELALRMLEAKSKDFSYLEALQIAGIAASHSGELEDARRFFSQERRLARETGRRGRAYVALYDLACIAALDGRREDALEHLQEAVAEGFASRSMKDDTDLETLHGSAEFSEILRQNDEKLEIRAREKTETDVVRVECGA